MEYSTVYAKVHRHLTRVADIPRVTDAEIEGAIFEVLHNPTGDGVSSLNRQGLLFEAARDKMREFLSVEDYIRLQAQSGSTRLTDSKYLASVLPEALNVLDAVESKGNEIKSKIELLTQHRGNPVLRWVFIAALDWHVAYGYADSFNVNLVEGGSGSMVVQWIKFVKLLDVCAKRPAVNNHLRGKMRTILEAMPRQARKWAYRILMRDLRIRVLDTTARKVWPDILPPYKVQLCATYTDGYPIPKMVYEAPKMDGFRMCVTVYNATKKTGVVRSRSGLEQPHLNFLVEQAAAILKAAGLRSAVLDGEGTDIEGRSWAKAASAVRTQDAEKAQSAMRFNVFDLIPVTSFEQGWGSLPRHKRIKRLQAALQATDSAVRPNIIPMNIRRISRKPAALLSRYNAHRTDGYEGMIAYDGNSVYCAGDSVKARAASGLIRFKPFETIDVMIIGSYEGKGTLAGTLGGFYCRTKAGVNIRIGGGFKLYERNEFWAERENLLYRVIEAERQSGATDIKSRHTNFLRLRPKSDSDMSAFGIQV